MIDLLAILRSFINFVNTPISAEKPKKKKKKRKRSSEVRNIQIHVVEGVAYYSYIDADGNIKAFKE